MPKWCMSCGNVKMPDMSDSVMRTKEGKLKWKSLSRAALRREKVVVCGNCWRIITWEA